RREVRRISAASWGLPLLQRPRRAEPITFRDYAGCALQQNLSANVSDESFGSTSLSLSARRWSGWIFFGDDDYARQPRRTLSASGVRRSKEKWRGLFLFCNPVDQLAAFNRGETQAAHSIQFQKMVASSWALIDFRSVQPVGMSPLGSSPFRV